MAFTGITGRPEPVDTDLSRRPGVPMLPKRGADPAGKNAHFPQQQTDVEILVGVEVKHLTPVFGTTCPPKGLSGWLRRAGYRIPEHKGGRWMLILLGDRVDVWENRMKRHPIATALVAAGILGGLSWKVFGEPRSLRRASYRRALVSRFT